MKTPKIFSIGFYYYTMQFENKQLAKIFQPGQYGCDIDAILDQGVMPFILALREFDIRVTKIHEFDTRSLEIQFEADGNFVMDFRRMEQFYKDSGIKVFFLETHNGNLVLTDLSNRCIHEIPTSTKKFMKDIISTYREKIPLIHNGISYNGDPKSLNLKNKMHIIMEIILSYIKLFYRIKVEKYDPAKHKNIVFNPAA